MRRHKKTGNHKVSECEVTGISDEEEVSIQLYIDLTAGDLLLIDSFQNLSTTPDRRLNKGLPFT
jgi:hypothetical protein